MSSSKIHFFIELIEIKSFSIDLVELFVNFALSLITLFILFPFIVPGQTALTLILNLPSSIASDFVTPIAAHLLAAYGVRKGKPSIPAVEDILIIDPFLDFLISGIAFLVK